MDRAHPIFDTTASWPGEGSSRVPFWAYTSEAHYKRELERFFYAKHWCYVGLDAEIPEAGDFKRTVIGERSVIMTRDHDGEIHVVENVCAHRGMRFCRENRGRAKELLCPYHQWTYSLKGDLQGVPFRRGVRKDGKINGGMPADFKPSENGLTQLKVARRGGVVFASFDHDVEPFEEFLGPTILEYFDRVFNGRTLKLLGYRKQRIPGNWKLMQENIKDPYHPGLLHTWFSTFGLWRADNDSQLKMDAHFRHAAMISTRGKGGKVAEVTAGVDEQSPCIAFLLADPHAEDFGAFDVIEAAGDRFLAVQASHGGCRRLAAQGLSAIMTHDSIRVIAMLRMKNLKIIGLSFPKVFLGDNLVITILGCNEIEPQILHFHPFARL